MFKTRDLFWHLAFVVLLGCASPRDIGEHANAAGDWYSNTLQDLGGSFYTAFYGKDWMDTPLLILGLVLCAYVLIAGVIFFASLVAFELARTNLSLSFIYLSIQILVSWAAYEFTFIGVVLVLSMIISVSAYELYRSQDYDQQPDLAEDNEEP